MSTTLTALIADDEPLARALLRDYLRSHPDIAIVGEADNGLQAVKEIGRLNPDLVFLDIQMPKLSGLEVLEATQRRSGVIFTTAFDAHALKAFDLHAVDYLLKPFSPTRFDEALRKARALCGEAQPSVDALLADNSQRLSRVLIREREQVHVLPVDTIDYVEAQDDYIRIHAGQRAHLKTQRLSDLEARLDPASFVRVHRSYLINLACLVGLERNGSDGYVACLRNGQRIPVSRSGYERLRQVM
ncbi:LytR/AlgR family response regulator transcription factor [Chitinimonas sp.]|uniref:LytR/AlgR family response regulator transcription factor n=1 Tax=Chitinimonas sp. TaxID=1934313 RepID=UPI0035AF5BAA